MFRPGIESTDAIVLAKALQQNNYVSVAIAAAVMYDYVLTFPKEVEYVWTLVIRLFPLCIGSLFWMLLCSSLAVLQGHYPFICKGYALYTLIQFAFILFLAAADMVMILRVWAMYNRSKFILSILLMVYIPEIVLMTVVAVIASIPENTVVITVLNRTFCLPVLPLYHWIEDALIFLIPAGVTCMLAIIQFIRQFLRMRRDTNRWKLDRYMNLLSRESIFYFLAILFFGVVDVQNRSISLGGQTWFGFLSVVSCVPVFTLTPRFILSLRALYARNLQNGSSCGIDTGFGFSESLDLDAWGTTMVFADVERDEEARGGEEKQMKDEEDAWSDLY